MSNPADRQLLYDLHENPPAGRTLVYALQWLIFTLANTAVVPLVVGRALGLDQPGVAALAQRTLFFSGLASLLQVLFGHRLPVMEGPSGMWWGVFITLASLAPGLGKPLAVLRSDLELGVLVAGVVLVLVGSSRLVGSALSLFTPAVTGSVLILLGLQLSGTFVRGMLGVGVEGSGANLRTALLSAVVVAVVLWVSLKGRPFTRSVAVLIGIGVGWLLAIPLGLAPGVPWSVSGVFELPRLFAWGTPTFDAGIIITSVVTGLLVLSNLVASILAMEKTVGRKVPRQAYDRGVVLTGAADIMAGVGATVGFVPFSAGAAMVGMTRVASRMPFILFAVMMAVLGLIPPVGAFLSSIPVPVGYSVLMVSFCQMVGFGLRDYLSLPLDNRDVYIIGLTLLMGTGAMMLPARALAGMPVLARYLLGNGFLSGMLLCILLEHVFLPAKFFASKPASSDDAASTSSTTLGEKGPGMDG
ncbi:uracil-xanthine permease family protein [Desulfofundulus sp.]|uniref:uracil-xanthine permease family protein n=1 Tax=Desulfofundulus sp. TaxID=2282750 RepID=UPI003C72CB55